MSKPSIYVYSKDLLVPFERVHDMRKKDGPVSDKDMKENKTLYLKAQVKFVGTTDLITVQHIIRNDMDPSALHR